MLSGIQWIGPALWVVGGLVAVALLIFLSNAVRYIPSNRVGIVEKLWSAKGSIKRGFIALEGEAGFQPAVLRGGWHASSRFSTACTSSP